MTWTVASRTRRTLDAWQPRRSPNERRSTSCTRSRARCRARLSRRAAPLSTRSAARASCSSGTRPDAVDPGTGERYEDVIVFWVGSEEEKQEILADGALPFFTTPHFDGHPSVLLRGSRVGELEIDQLAEMVYDAWLARAPKRAAWKWLAERGLEA